MLPRDSIILTGEIFHAFRYSGDFLLDNNGIESLSVSSESLRSYIEDATDGEDVLEEERDVWAELKL